MDHLRLSSGNGEDSVGLADDLRCKRSDGKQWRCTAKSMPDKTVCEKHYIQAKKRAANSAMRASLKKAKRKSLGDTDGYLDIKSEDFEMPLANVIVDDHTPSISTKKYKERVSKHQAYYSPDTHTRSLSTRNDHLQRDFDLEEEWRSYKTPPLSAMDSSWSRSQKSLDANAMVDCSDVNTNSSDGAGVQACHQCRRRDRNRVIWCTKCDRRGFCDSCITAWHSDLKVEEIEMACPACRGTCNCKVCLRGDNMVKVRIREISALDKLQYLYCLLSSVLPIVKQIHNEQVSEVELEQRLRGADIDFVRTRLNADEQMCCNVCRVPIIDYHRHCANCSYDLCLHCCRDLREVSMCDIKSALRENQPGEESQEKGTELEKVKECRLRLDLLDKYPDWKANTDGSISCPPKEYGGCNHLSLTLSRIFKINWVAKLVKNVEEMVSGCKVYDGEAPFKLGTSNSMYQCVDRDYSDDNILYCRSSAEVKAEGVKNFRKHWVRGEPVIVKQVFDSSSMSCWDPVVVWKGIQDTSDEKTKDADRFVKAIDCLNCSEVNIQLGQFIKGYSEGRVQENGTLEILKLKDWPSPSAAEEFLLYQRPEFISKLPLLEYIHSRLGLLNVAAKLPNYSLQNDIGPKIYISYGTCDERGGGDSQTNLHSKTRDMVYLLVHICKVKLKSWKENEDPNKKSAMDELTLPDSSLHGNEEKIVADKNEVMEDQGADTTMEDQGADTMEDQGADTTMEDQGADTMEDQGVDTTMEDQGVNTTMEDRGVDPTMEDRGVDTTMDRGVDTTMEDRGVDTTMDDRGVDTTMDDLGVNAAVEDQGVDVAVEDQVVDAAVEEQGGGVAAVDDLGVNAAVEDQGVDAPVEDRGVDAPVEDRGVDAPVEDRRIDAAVEDQQVDAAVENQRVDAAVEDRLVDAAVEDRLVDAAVEDQRVDAAIKDKGVDATSEDESQTVDAASNVREVEKLENQSTTDAGKEVERMEDKQLKKACVDISVDTLPGVHWDVFRRKDVGKLNDYLRRHHVDLVKANALPNDFGSHSLYDGMVFLNERHKTILKEECGVEPWSFVQYLGEAVFVPAGCPFQTRNLNSTVQLGLDFLSPESVGEAARMAEEIRCLPNEHEAKNQVLEVGKISLYAASSAIKEVQKLVLDSELGAEIGFEDPNLTAPVSENLEKLTKLKQISCA